MGRPKGDGNRSKARPSSSSLAASLLPSGTAAVGFGGYVGSSRVESSLSSDDASPFLDIDGEVVQHLKRLARKDPTTKIKALTSLSMILKQKSSKEILPIIPQWAFEYKKLLSDYNREVRRATHDTMILLVAAVGRDLAPHLKSLMGPWWVSQFDPASEVSQAAKRSFQAAFPAQEKRLDALILCTTEVFMYLEENLNLTPQSMSDKATALDELEVMHQQVISSSLLALATLLDILVGSQYERPGLENIAAEQKKTSKARTTAISYAENLFPAHKYFLEFLKSQSPAIRTATYSVLRSFIKNIPHAFSEGNMKTLAMAILGSFQEKDPTCHSSMWDTILLFSKTFPDSWTIPNVQKTLLSRFWQFLRNGCFGSQQVSYPALVIFLDAIPPKSITGEKFFLEFFQNFLAGRNPSHSLNADPDRLAFFQAFRECFLWGLQNASRYCGGADAVYSLQVSLIDKILLKLMWHEFLPISPKNQERVFSVESRDPSYCNVKPFHEEAVETFKTKYPIGYIQELGKCIIEILSGIYSLEHDLLLPFSTVFQENCLEIFKQTENVESSSEVIERVITFLLLLGQSAVQKGEKWPLVNMVGPMLAKSFPLIKTLDSPDIVRLASVAVSVFGPRKIIRELVCGGYAAFSSLSDCMERELESEQFLQLYKEIFVPWCLQGNGSSTSARLDLLLALLDNECFPEQWDSIITYATDLELCGLGTPDPNNILVLAMLMEKARMEICKRKVGVDLVHQQGSHADHWHHELLDSSAISTACSNPSFRSSDARFIRAVLGGSTEDDQTCFVSRNAKILIFKELCKNLVTFALDSTFTWVKKTCSLLTAEANDSVPRIENVLEMAHFSLEVLDGSFYCLKTIEDENELVPGTLAAIFLIDWEYRLAIVSNAALDDETTRKMKSRTDFCAYVHSFRGKISNQFFKSLSLRSRNSLGSILVQSIRFAVFKEDEADIDKLTSLCCLWMLEVLEVLGQDQFEEQALLDQFLSKGDFWPLWILPDFCTGGKPTTLEIENISVNASRNHIIVAVIDELISKIGIDSVVTGSVSRTSPSTEEATNELITSQSAYSRSWLAAEMLCTWKWHGGSALSSFLPLLSTYGKSGNFPHKESLFDSIVNILLDGALVHGASAKLSLTYVWPVSCDEMKCVEEPFLRALASLVFTLFEDNIWGKDKAMLLFKLLANKLFIGETINLNCLRILPLIMSIIIRPLSNGCGEPNQDVQHDSFEENEMHDTIKDWLQRTLSFPPPSTWKIEEMEDWFHLVISCYPLSEVEGIQGLKPERSISSIERTILHELFRKLRLGSRSSTVANKLPTVQMLLSRMMVVSIGYCWKEFNDEDWEFVVYQLRSWIESAVVMMEEVAENVNEVVTNISISNNSEDAVEKLEHAVSVLNPSPVKIATNALAAFSLFSGVVGLQKKEDADNLNPLETERWDPIRDRILESILRLFFSTGAAEAIAGSCCSEGSFILASTRLDYPHFWELVASSVAKSSAYARDKAVKSVELWGLSKGPVSSLYAILFSSKPLPVMQFAAYVILSSEPVSKLSISREDTAGSLDGDIGDQVSYRIDLSSEEEIHLREEISFMLKKLPYEILEIDLVAPQRVNVFLAWSLFLSHLLSLPSSSPARERLVQYIQEHADSAILDCLFQHIPLELCLSHSLKKKDVELPTMLSEAASAATRAITGSSVLFCVESLWPIGPEKMASLAGAIFGLILCILPAYVRGWFGDIRDRSTSAAIESFTKIWCSPPLIRNELSQIKKSSFTDENFSVSVSKSANEVVATYTKDETGMDLVIRLPASYPLRAVDVDCPRSLGISEVKQRKWLMSMLLFVRNQNGALAEAIRIWKSNFDKEFEGVEECPICYSVIHTANHSLPRLACKTCKHKFHSACLYKWFSTSHKSTCPLCQSPF
ncbi:E3 ubiquitin-protein ligase listerin-like isoform X2 [Actinidia eriantha]|uniref:E3 ubiquitin-protein ligase listerin-like isoform X2 n=1 Tax=Actinidia eriantha TaxID=165200 RepID=UPI002586F082|nr:E3 ubiquitin-protein ligase listerin-like isoform X2 [Actinidia eriantha]